MQIIMANDVEEIESVVAFKSDVRTTGKIVRGDRRNSHLESRLPSQTQAHAHLLHQHRHHRFLKHVPESIKPISPTLTVPGVSLL